MLKNSLFQPSLFSTLSLFQPSFSFSFSAAHFFFVSVSWLAAPFSSPLFFQPSFSFLQVSCPLFFSPNVFQPKNTFFNPKRFCFSPKLFSVQPKTFFFVSVQPLFSSSFFCFILFWFNPLFFLSAPHIFLFFSSIYPRPNVLFSCFTSLLFE